MQSMRQPFLPWPWVCESCNSTINKSVLLAAGAGASFPALWLVQTSRAFHDLNLNFESGIMIVWKQRCEDYLNGCLRLRGENGNNGFVWIIGKNRQYVDRRVFSILFGTFTVSSCVFIECYFFWVLCVFMVSVLYYTSPVTHLFQGSKTSNARHSSFPSVASVLYYLINKEKYF